MLHKSLSRGSAMLLSARNSTFDARTRSQAGAARSRGRDTRARGRMSGAEEIDPSRRSSYLVAMVHIDVVVVD
jgi:hypothetical protein